MWIFFGIGAIITGLLNLVWYAKGKNPEIFRFASISLTALTVCATYTMAAKWVISEDWSALMDTMPTMSKAFWFLVIASIMINGITLIKKKK